MYFCLKLYFTKNKSSKKTAEQLSDISDLILNDHFMMMQCSNHRLRYYNLEAAVHLLINGTLSWNYARLAALVINAQNHLIWYLIFKDLNIKNLKILIHSQSLNTCCFTSFFIFPLLQRTTADRIGYWIILSTAI